MPGFDFLANGSMPRGSGGVDWSLWGCLELCYNLRSICVKCEGG